MACEIVVTRRVEFSETDMAGIMHFSNYFRFMETAEHAFFRSIGFSVVLSKLDPALCLPRVHVECDYSAPLLFEDEVDIHMLVASKSARSLGYEFRFYKKRAAGRTKVAHGTMKVTCAARQADGTMKSAPLPAALAQKIEVAPAHRLGAEDHQHSVTPTHDLL